MKKQDEQIIWKKRRGDRFETFAVELEEFTKTGRLPESCDQDMKFCLELQRERLREKGILMKYAFVPRGHFAEGGGIGRGFEDAHYKTRMEYRTCCWEKTFYQDKRSIYSSKENTIFYQMITDTQDSHSVEMDSYVCPNCGAISQVKELINGCSYCKTFFKVEDLFPKTTNFYMIKDYGHTTRELPIYEGNDSVELFSDIIDSSYRGALALKNFSVQGNYCYVTVEAYMENLYYENIVRKKNDKYQLVLRKNITTPIQMNFSIKKISCTSCGVSFDATMQRSCPSCNAKYEIADEDWVIMKILK